MAIDSSIDMEQLFQTLLLNRSLDDGDSSEGSSSGLNTARSGPAEALRELRRSGPLRELSGEAFTRLLAGTLYEYDHSAPPTPLTTPGGPLGLHLETSRGGGDLDTTLGLLETAIEEDAEQSADSQSASGSGAFAFDASGRGAFAVAEPLMVSFAADSEGSPSPSSTGGPGTARSADDSRPPSLWSTARSEARSDGFWRTARTVFGDTTAMSFLGGERPPHDDEDGTVNAHVRDMLRQLAGDGELDEGLAQSARRMVQLGAVASGQRLSDEEIQSLPKVKFEQVEQQTCSICLEIYQQGEMLTALRCAHFFHTSCVTRWFHRSTQCPLCRTVQGGD